MQLIICYIYNKSIKTSKKTAHFFVFYNRDTIFALAFQKQTRFDSLAQLVEHNTFNVGVLGSNPRRITKRNTTQQ